MRGLASGHHAERMHFSSMPVCRWTCGLWSRTRASVPFETGGAIHRARVLATYLTNRADALERGEIAPPGVDTAHLEVIDQAWASYHGETPTTTKLGFLDQVVMEEAVDTTHPDAAAARRAAATWAISFAGLRFRAPIAQWELVIRLTRARNSGRNIALAELARTLRLGSFTPSTIEKLRSRRRQRRARD